jgi:hypothetical protein
MPRTWSSYEDGEPLMWAGDQLAFIVAFFGALVFYDQMRKLAQRLENAEQPQTYTLQQLEKMSQEARAAEIVENEIAIKLRIDSNVESAEVARIKADIAAIIRGDEIQ